MKHVLILTSVVLITGLLALASCSNPEAGKEAAVDQKASEPEVALASTTVELPTMKCKMCRNNIKKAVTALDGVKETEFDMENKNVAIRYVDGTVDLPKIEMAIANVGYDANNTKRIQEAYDQLDDCCK